MNSSLIFFLEEARTWAENFLAARTKALPAFLGHLRPFPIKKWQALVFVQYIFCIILFSEASNDLALLGYQKDQTLNVMEAFPVASTHQAVVLPSSGSSGCSERPEELCMVQPVPPRKSDLSGGEHTS